MTQRTCPGCGVDKPRSEFYTDRNKTSGYGSRCKDCDRAKGRAYYQANREAKLAAAKERHRRNRSQHQPLPDRSCDVCQQQYTPRRRDQRYCTPECHRKRPETYNPERNRIKMQRRKLRRLAARLAEWSPEAAPLLLAPGPQPQATCEQCDQTFIADRPRRYCTDECAANAKLIQDRARSRLLTLGTRRWIGGRCGECGNWYVGKTQDRFCTETCSKRNRRRRDKKRRSKRIRDAARRETVDLARVAIRDGWRCHICHRKVSRKDWSLDHLVPLSHGGDHTYDNVALAHCLCNSIRGAHGHAQLRLAA